MASMRLSQNVLALTLSPDLIYKCGGIDKRTIEKFEKVSNFPLVPLLFPLKTALVGISTFHLICRGGAKKSFGGAQSAINATIERHLNLMHNIVYFTRNFNAGLALPCGSRHCSPCLHRLFLHFWLVRENILMHPTGSCRTWQGFLQVCLGARQAKGRT